MRNLLSAYFERLLKSRVFWICCAVMAACALWRGSAEFHMGPDQDPQSRWAVVLFGELLFELPCALAVFTGIFMGAEYEGNALRNKLISGHSRRTVYVSALLITTFAGVVILLLYSGITAFLCWLAHGPMPDPTGISVHVAAVFLLCVAWSAIFTAIALNCSRPSVSVVACLATVAVFSVICDRFLVTDILTHESAPLSRFIYDLLPAGQGDQLRCTSSSNLSRPPAELIPCSALFIVMTTASGLVLFRIRDQK